MRKLKASLIIFSLLFGVTLVSAQSGPSTNVEATLINTDPVPVQSGEDADLRFKVVNDGSTEADNVQVELVEQYPFEVKPDRKTNYSLGTLVPGQEYHITTEVLVAEDAPDGSNDLKVRISHGRFSKTVNVPVEVQSDDIELNLANLQTTPSELMPDTEDNKINLEVVNNGDKAAENVVVDLGFPKFFEETSSFSTRQALGNVEAGETKTADFRFDINETAPEGEVEIPTTISYSADDSSAEIEKKEDFSVYLSGKPQFKVVESSSNLKAGSPGKVEIAVKNVGEEKSSSTRIRVLESADQPLSYRSSSQFVGTLKPGASGTAVFDVTPDSDAEAKDYLVDFEIRGVKDTEVFTKDVTQRLKVENGGDSSSGLSIPVIIGLLVVAGLFYRFRDEIRGRLGEDKSPSSD